MISVPIYVVDFEGSLASGVVEYGIAVLHKGEITQVFTSICRARNYISSQEESCHGIKFDDTLPTEPFSEHWNLFKNCRAKGPFAAHNATFENRLMCRYLPKPGIVPAFLSNEKTTLDWAPWIDSYNLYKRCFDKINSYKLQNLINCFELNDKLEEYTKFYCPKNRCVYHCALFDAIACALLIQNLMEIKIVNRMNLDWLIVNGSQGISSLNDLNQIELF